jgi:hypothetical protein
LEGKEMKDEQLEWQDCDIEGHAEGWCFLATTKDGEALRDCQDLTN